jgi:hypothetical protein
MQREEKRDSWWLMYQNRDSKPFFLLALGGAVWGGFLGIFGGALLGTVYGLFVGDVSLGLDGAILGGSSLSFFGAALGVAWCWLDGRYPKAVPPSGPEEKAPRQREETVRTAP